MAKKMTKKSAAEATAVRTVEVQDCPAVRVKVMGGGALPAGGTAGQVLTKTSDTDYDTEWRNVDTVVTEDSANPITSGAVYAVLGDVETLINAL